MRTHLQIYTDGVPLIDEIFRALDSVEISHAEGEAQICTLEFKLPAARAELLDSWVFSQAVPWVVVLGLGDAVPFGPFQVEIPNFIYEAGAVRWSMTLKDTSSKMSREPKYRKFSGGMSVGQIVEEIANDYGIPYEIDNATYHVFDEDKPLIQDGVTDSVLLARLAQSYGFTMAFRSGVMYFKQSRLNEDRPTIKVLEYGTGVRTLKSFEVQQDMKAAKQGSPVKAAGIDIKTGKPFGLKAPVTGSTQGDTTHPADDALENDLKGHGKENRDQGPVKANEVSEGERNQYVFDGPSGLYLPLNPKFGQLPPPAEDLKNKSTEAPQNKDQARKSAAASRAGKRSDTSTATAQLTLPDTTILVGDLVEVVGLIALRHRGRWRVTEVTHRITNSSFTTSLSTGKKGLGDSKATKRAPGKKKISDEDKNQGVQNNGGRDIEEKVKKPDILFGGPSGEYRRGNKRWNAK